MKTPKPCFVRLAFGAHGEIAPLPSNYVSFILLFVNVQSFDVGKAFVLLSAFYCKVIVRRKLTAGHM